LRGTKAISEEEFDLRTKTTREAQATLAAAKAAIGAAEAAVSAAVAAETNATLNLEYTRVKAPINGRIGRRFVTEGNLVQGSAAGATVLATIVSLDPIYCYFDVNDQAFPLYRRQMGAPGAAGRETSLTCELSVGAETNFAYQGQVDFYDNEVNAKTGTIRMRGVFANADRRLVPGLFGLVRIPTGPPQETMAVPAVAVSSDQGRSFVMVVNNENVVLPKPIKAERQHGALRAVPEGLNLNDRVIINGLMMARPGSKVVITNAPASGGAAMPKANP
jgi:RND family efflux transporter MFP subunit